MSRQVYFREDIRNVLAGLALEGEEAYHDAMTMLAESGVDVSQLISQRRGSRRTLLATARAFGIQASLDEDGRPLLGDRI